MRGRLKAARSTEKKLKELEASMRRRVNTGASPPIDLELVQARVLETEVDITDVLVLQDVALDRLEQLSGIDGVGRREGARLDLLMPEKQEFELHRAYLATLNWVEVAKSSPPVVSARKGVKGVEARLQAKRAERWPEVYARLDHSFGSGSNDSRGASTAAYLGVRYTPGAGFSNWYEAKALDKRVSQADEDAEAALREMQQQLSAERQSFFTGPARVSAKTSAVKAAANVLASYERQFLAGRRSWQELMNAVRDVAQAEYALEDAKGRTASAMYSLLMRAGNL